MFRTITAIALLAGASDMAHAKERRLPQNGQSARYICADGRRIEVLYGGGGTVLTVGGAVAQLDHAPDTDEEHYSGSGWSWSVTSRRSGLLASAAAPHAIACQVG
jgi:hypothetical protein